MYNVDPNITHRAYLLVKEYLYIGKFENISVNNVLGHLFSHKVPQNTDLGIVKKL